MIKTEEYNKGLIYTGISSCNNCSKCIHECPVLKSNVLTMDGDGKYKICVDDKECILCGMCLDICVHNSRYYKDDCNDFFENLKKGKEISVIVAPAFYLNYPNEYKNIFGYLRSIGVKNFYPVSFGADITTWGYLNYMETKSVGLITQPCPTVVMHIEKHYPELLSNLVPVQSPMMCTAIYLKKYKNVTEELAFLSPCISKKIEIESERGLGLIKYNVTFKRLAVHFNNINFKDFPEVDEELEHGMGSLFPMVGGLQENIQYYLGPEAMIMKVDGTHRANNFLKVFAAEPNESKFMPTLVDILNCENGCCQGTGTGFHDSVENRISYQSLIFRNEVYGKVKAHNQLDPVLRLAKLNEKFKHLNPKDFICEYSPDKNIHSQKVSEEEIQEIITKKLQKYSENDRHINCTACGYKTCRDMAKAIALGINHQDSCISYVRNRLVKIRDEKISSEAELRMFINVMPVPIHIESKNADIIECNKETLRLFEMSNINEYKMNYNTLWPEHQPDGNISWKKAKKIYAEAFEKGYSRFEWMYLSAKGEPIPCEATLLRVKWNGKEHMAVFLKDLREQFKLRETMLQLEESVESENMANQAKTRFLARMSHEMRTPLNSVLGITGIQLQKTTHPEDTEEAFSRIYSSADLLLSIINDILDLSKVEAGKMEIIPAAYKISSTIVDTVQLNLMYIDNKKIDFMLEVDKNLPVYLIGDEIRIKQILNNILSNAFKYTNEGYVKLNFSVEPGSTEGEIIIVVVVTDTGQGMTKEQVDGLFGREFTRFNVEFNREIEGSGLGLNIAHQLIVMMGGEIKAESESGIGTTFTMRIPQKLEDDRVIGEEGALALQNLKDTHHSMKRNLKFEHEPMPYGRVLVVDDVESNLFVAKGFLRPYKLQVEAVESGAYAVDKIKSGEVYDIIFMDHMMPGMDGIEATEIIRDTGYEHPIVALTANAFSDMEEMFISKGFTGFASKPIEFTQLNSFLMSLIFNKQPPEVIIKARRAKAASEAGRDRGISVILTVSFLRDAKKAVAVLELMNFDAELTESELENYIVQIHAMKNTLRHIGRNELSNTARILEQAGRNKNLERISKESPGFLQSLYNIIAEFNIDDDDENIQQDMSFFRKKMKSIADACVFFEIEDATEAINELHKKEYSKQTKVVINEIEKLLLSNDFEEAGELAEYALKL